MDAFCSAEWIKPLGKRIAKGDTSWAANALASGLAELGGELDWVQEYTEPVGRCIPVLAPQGESAQRSGHPLFETLNAFLSDANGGLPRCLLLLGETGAGKTATLTVLHLFAQSGNWPAGLSSMVTKAKLDLPEQLARIENPEQFVLLIDGLEELPIADGEFEPYLDNLFEATCRFHRVIASAHNRFFAKQLGLAATDNPNLGFGGQRCALLFQYGFDEAGVEAYLNAKYTKHWFPKRKRDLTRGQAQEIAERMGKLCFRPLMLANLEALATREDSLFDDYSLIESILLQWLLSQADEGRPIEVVYDLIKRLACAATMSSNPPPADVAVDDITTLASSPRSLLNTQRSEDGGIVYRFSHRSIRDFVVAQHILDASDATEIVVPPDASEDCLNFVAKGRQRDEEHQSKKLVLRGIKLSDFTFEKADLQNTVIEGADLRNASFKNADLTGLELKNCRLDGASFKEAIGTGAHLDRLVAGMPFGLPLGDGCELELLWVEPGDLLIGTGEYAKKMPVKFGYWMGKLPVTQRQYETLIGSNPSGFPESGDDAPVEHVSWVEAQLYCDRLSNLLHAMGHSKYLIRLPKEIEWEYACRAGSHTLFCFGDNETDLPRHAWFNLNSDNQTKPTGRRASNAWGFHDMHGNVWEWCDDWSGDFLAAKISDLKGPEQRRDRVIRGGSWSNQAQSCRSNIRNWHQPTARYNNLGFRVVLVPQHRSSETDKKKIGM